jgi:hypothetical protein
MRDAQSPSMPVDHEDNVPTLVDGDEDDMTSIMSPDQRRALQHAAAKEAETLERDTARPPPPAEAGQAVVIPKAAPVPGALGTSAGKTAGATAGATIRGAKGATGEDAEPPPSRVRRSEPGRPGSVPTQRSASPVVTSEAARKAGPAAEARGDTSPAPSSRGALSLVVLVPFVLLALAVVAALRM